MRVHSHSGQAAIALADVRRRCYRNSDRGVSASCDRRACAGLERQLACSALVQQTRRVRDVQDRPQGGVERAREGEQRHYARFRHRTETTAAWQETRECWHACHWRAVRLSRTLRLTHRRAGLGATNTMAGPHMTTRSVHEDDPLDDFDCRTTRLLDSEKKVHVAGAGPAVIVMTEMPGISPHVARFARWVRDAGFTVYMPSLFGRDGVVATADEGAQVFRRACVSAEFRAMAANQSSRVNHWLRALARLAHEACGGPGVGAIGMCFTGNFALTMMLEPAMLAPVLSQPSLPLNDPAGLEISPEEIAQVARRLNAEDLSVLAFRFEGDHYCRAERFAAYAQALGDRFVARVLPDSAANPDVPPFFAQHVPCAHSVVTAHLIDEAGQPTVAARDEILQFFARRLIAVKA
jgi:dienelactone hydrolase